MPLVPSGRTATVEFPLWYFFSSSMTSFHFLHHVTVPGPPRRHSRALKGYGL